MSKKAIANTVMVILIIAIAFCGVLGVGYIKGRFDKPEKETAVLTDVRGVVSLKRSGAAYTVSGNSVLRSGDGIVCDSGAEVCVDLGDGYITLGPSAQAKIINPESDEFSAQIIVGEAFVFAKSPIKLEFDGKRTQISNAAATLSVRKGTQSVSVYYGKVENAEAGQTIEWLDGEPEVRSFTVNSLNEFNIAQIRKANAERPLIFTNDDLDRLQTDRLKEIQNENAEQASPAVSEKQLENTSVPTVGGSEPATENGNTVGTNPFDFTKTVRSTESSKYPSTTKAQSTVRPQVTTKPSAERTYERTTALGTAQSNVGGKPDSPDVTQSAKPKLSCTVTIRCDTILNNLNELDPAKAPYVPKNGCILPVVKAEFTEGETVFDVLKRVCGQNGIQLEYSWTPMYGSYYIEGINNLYEFDCGSESGWMYKVNGWFPNYGCSSYILTGGESVVWCYTCKGLGKDVGAEY